jgi:predicted transcriptional regulator
MANLSVKLDDVTRRRLQEAAAIQGQTPHALMVKAIECEIDRVEAESAFVSQALQARARVIEGGAVVDGMGFSNYLKARVRGLAAERPEAKPLEAHFGNPA